MATRRTEYPLSWPPNWPRTPEHARVDAAGLKQTLSAAIARVEKNLELFGSQSSKPVTEVMISSNVTLSRQAPKDAGVAVFFTWDGIATCIAVDRYRKLEQNLQAIALVIEAERTKMRHGGLNLVRASFMGYTALPAPSKSGPWYDVLEVREDASASAIVANYKRLRSDHHPDKGGNADKFHAVQQAFDDARARGKVS